MNVVYKLKRVKHRTYAMLPMTHISIPLFRNAYALIFSATTTSLLGMVYWAVAARLYPVEAVGLNSAIISAMALVSGFARLNLDDTLVRFVPRSGHHLKRLIAVTYSVAVVLTGVFSLLFLSTLSLWSPTLAVLGSQTWLVAGFTISAMASSLFSMQDAILTGLRKAIWVPIENTIFATTKLCLLVAIAQAASQYGIFLSWSIPLLVSIVVVNALIVQRLTPEHAGAASESTITPREFFSFVGGNYVAYLFRLTYTNLLPVIVVSSLGARAAAYFALPWLISTSLQLVSANMNTSLVVEATRDRPNLAVYARRTVRQTALILIPVIMVVVATAPFILQIYGPQYASEGTTLLRLLVVALIPNMLVSLFMGISRVQGNTGHMIAIQASICLLALGLSAVLLPWYGIEGIGFAWLGSQLLVGISVVGVWLRRAHV
jgi:O-antigen/teichoic acid export membrane protein